MLKRYHRKDPTQDLVDYLKTVQSGQINNNGLQRRLDQLTEEVRRQGQLMQNRQEEQRTQMASIGDQVRDQVSSAVSSLSPFGQSSDKQQQPSVVDRAMQFGFTTLMGTVLGRTDLSDLDVEKIVDQIQSARDKVTKGAQQITGQTPPFNPIKADVENYLHSTDAWQLGQDRIASEFREVLYDPEADPATVRRYLEQINRQNFVNVLAERGVITPERIEAIADRLEAVRLEVLNQVRIAAEQEYLQDLQNRVENYLRSAPKEELAPDAMDRELSDILNDSDADYETLKTRLSYFDRPQVLDYLLQRQDTTPEEANRIVSQLESVRDNVLHTPQMVVHQAQAVVDQAKDQTDEVLSRIENYLRNTNLFELDPDGIRRDLNTLLHDPRAGMYRLRARLSQIDRETLVRLLAQRPDMTEAQANQTIDQVLASIRGIVRSPRRVASRTQHQVQDFQSTLATYLRDTNKEELNPEGIQRDLQLLLRDPRAGLGNLSDRLSHIDRSTIVALLSQRKDMTEDEANRIVDQVLAVRQQAMAQIQAVQDRIQSVINGILDRIRTYLNSLERPELNYEGIRDDIRTLFNDPRAGFDALRDRLGSFNRETLVALLASREDMSEAEANRIVDQIENARNNVLRRAERIQQETQHRLEEVKRQARRQAKETRKAAETAAWWLFGTAIVSAAASAIAGAIAVG
jgi:hypothetical protein